MATWYQSIVWRTVKHTYCPGLIKRNNVEVKDYGTEPEPPFIFISNHAHQTDPFIVGPFFKSPINYMANEGAKSFMTRLAGKMIGTYPKKKGMPDAQAVAKTFELLKNGHVTGLFVEGDRSWDGETQKISPRITELIRAAGTPVRISRLTGNYVSWPRWAKNKRFGKILIEFYTLSKDEIDSMTDDELYKKISELLYRNDVKEELVKETTYSGEDLADGIHFLIWLCPSCESQDTIVGEGDDIVCTQCGKRWHLTGNLQISPESQAGFDIKDWSDWQMEKMKKLVKKAKKESITSTPGVILNEEIDDRKHPYAEGDLLLYKDSIIFSPHNDKDEIIFEVPHIKYYVDNFNKSFQFSYKDRRFVLEMQGKNASKWIFFLRHLQGRD